ncbi:MAG: hypothetical protein J6Q69_02285 [Clostridia bacterium]|nr:hypothetical protein [Clostridia bacterium]
MIVLKHNGTVYIAKSCWGTRDPEAERLGVCEAENIPMWHPDRKRNRLIGVTRCGRFVDAIRYEKIFPSVLDPKHVILESYEKIYSIAERYDLVKNYFVPARVVFAEDDRAFVVHGDGAYIEVEDVFAASCDNEVVMALHDLKGVSDPYEFFREAYATLEITNNYLMFPVIVLNTRTNKIEIINK